MISARKVRKLQSDPFGNLEYAIRQAVLKGRTYVYAIGYTEQQMKEVTTLGFQVEKQWHEYKIKW